MTQSLRKRVTRFLEWFFDDSLGRHTGCLLALAFFVTGLVGTITIAVVTTPYANDLGVESKTYILASFLPWLLILFMAQWSVLKLTFVAYRWVRPLPEWDNSIYEREYPCDLEPGVVAKMDRGIDLGHANAKRVQSMRREEVASFGNIVEQPESIQGLIRACGADQTDLSIFEMIARSSLFDNDAMPGRKAKEHDFGTVRMTAPIESREANQALPTLMILRVMNRLLALPQIKELGDGREDIHLHWSEQDPNAATAELWVRFNDSIRACVTLSVMRVGTTFEFAGGHMLLLKQPWMKLPDNWLYFWHQAIHKQEIFRQESSLDSYGKRVKSGRLEVDQVQYQFPKSGTRSCDVVFYPYTALDLYSHFRAVERPDGTTSTEFVRKHEASPVHDQIIHKNYIYDYKSPPFGAGTFGGGMMASLYECVQDAISEIQDQHGR